MAGLVQRIAVGVHRGIGALLEALRPRPETIQVVAIRGDGQFLGGTVVEAGSSRSWRTTVTAAVDGVLVVSASLSAEHGHGPLDDEPDTTVALAVFLDGARVGRAVETVRRGDVRCLALTATIRVAAGNRQLRAEFHPGGAAVRIAEVSVAAFFVPGSQASITGG